MGKTHTDVKAAGEMARRAEDSALKDYVKPSKAISRSQNLKDAQSNSEQASKDYLNSLQQAADHLKNQ